LPSAPVICSTANPANFSTNQVVLVKEEKILAVGAAATVQIPPDAQIIDLSKNTVLPGLIDGHTHIFGSGLDGVQPGGPPFASPINDTREYRTLLALANAQKDLLPCRLQSCT
jgi:imidazolonepropionase-like amidohydrolase